MDELHRSITDRALRAWLTTGPVDRGVDVAATKQAEKALVVGVSTVKRLGERWFMRDIEPRDKHPDVVARVLRKHINPVIGAVAPARLFRMAVRNHWIDRNPPAGPQSHRRGPLRTSPCRP